MRVLHLKFAFGHRDNMGGAGEPLSPKDMVWPPSPVLRWAPLGTAVASGLQGLRWLLFCRSPLPAPGSRQQNSSRGPLFITYCSPRLEQTWWPSRFTHNCPRLILSYVSLFVVAPGREWVCPSGRHDQSDTSMIYGIYLARG